MITTKDIANVRNVLNDFLNEKIDVNITGDYFFNLWAFQKNVEEAYPPSDPFDKYMIGEKQGIDEYIKGNPNRKAMREAVETIGKFLGWAADVDFEYDLIQLEADPWNNCCLWGNNNIFGYMEEFLSGTDFKGTVDALTYWKEKMEGFLNENGSSREPKKTGDSFGKEEPQQETLPRQEPFKLPPELNTERMRKVVERALGRGWMECAGNCLNWRGCDGKGTKAHLAFLMGEVFGERTPHQALESLFNVKRLDRALRSVRNAKKQETAWRETLLEIVD